jgi:hypothetical protein
VADYDIWQNIHITVLSIQEFIISGLYIHEARKILQPTDHYRREQVRQVMKRLIYVNVLVILLDIAVMCTQYAGMYQVHVAFKGAIYSVKLVLEFFVLNQLADVSGAGLLIKDLDLNSCHGNPEANRDSLGNSENSQSETRPQDENHAVTTTGIKDEDREHYCVSSTGEAVKISHSAGI